MRMEQSYNDFDRGNPKYWEINLSRHHFWTNMRMEQSCNDFYRGNPKYLEINLPQGHFNFHHKIHMEWPGAELRTRNNMMSNGVDKLHVSQSVYVRLSVS